MSVASVVFVCCLYSVSMMELAFFFFSSALVTAFTDMVS